MEISVLLTCYDRAAREVIAVRVAGLGCTVALPTPDAALDLIASNKVDVVMVGPSAHGRERQQLIATLEQHPRIPVVVDVTARDADLGADFVHRLGCNRVELLMPPLSGLNEVLGRLRKAQGLGP